MKVEYDEKELETKQHILSFLKYHVQKDQKLVILSIIILSLSSIRDKKMKKSYENFI
jgi:hypothetical protein